MPTDAQLRAAATATRGDDVYAEDADVTALEKRIAALAGKEACLFAASGTMTNQLAIRSHLVQPPHAVLVDQRAHVHQYEAGGIALFSQATTHTVTPKGDHMTVEEVEGALQLGSDVHRAPTRLVCLENTLSGMVFPQAEIVKIADLVRSHGILLHLDGARLWNVAARAVEGRGLGTGEEDLRAVLSDLLAPFDSASLCLSKGLGAPIGSALVGPKKLVDRARWFRKAFGGGWRQAGSIAAMADHAITHHFPRLAGTHALARRLADGLQAAGYALAAPVDTNMVFFDPPAGVSVDEVVAALAALPDPITLAGNRCVLHHQTSPEAVGDFIEVARKLAEKAGASGQAEPDRKRAKLGY
jgi:threonine aldolase